MNNFVRMLLFVTMTVALNIFPVAQAADNGTAALFTLSFTGAEGESTPTGRWWSISGGRPNIEIATSTVGSDIHEQKRPGQVYYADITVKGPFVRDRRAIMDWVNGKANGKRERVDMTLSFSDENGQPESAYILYDVLPISYQPPGVSAGNYDMLEESLTFHVERIVKFDGVVAPTSPNPSDVCLFGGKFRVDFDGDTPATSFSGGGVTFDKGEVTGGEGQDTMREYTITKVNWANIVIEKNIVQEDTKWKDWFWRQGKGQIDLKSVTLEYQDSEGRPVRHIDFQNCWPVRYDIINVDSHSGASSAKEIIECVVGYVVYQ